MYLVFSLCCPNCPTLGDRDTVPLWDTLGHFCPALGHFWDTFVPLWDTSVPLWDTFVPLWDTSGTLLSHLGTLLGHYCPALGHFWDTFVPPWDTFGTLLSHFRGIWDSGTLWDTLGQMICLSLVVSRSDPQMFLQRYKINSIYGNNCGIIW